MRTYEILAAQNNEGIDMKDRIHFETNRYYDSMKTGRDVTNKEVEAQMQILLNRIHDIGDDETLDALINCSGSWGLFSASARMALKKGDNITTDELKLLGIQARAFYEMVEMMFRISMESIAIENAHNEADKDDCQ